MTYFDTHFHLGEGDDFATIYQTARDAGVTRFVLSGTETEDSRVYRDLANQYEGVYSTVGCHPHESDHCHDLSIYRDLAVSSDKVVAIGEVGLDYFYEYSDRVQQRRVFEQFIDLAEELKKPLVIHCRNAEADCRDILKDRQPSVPWVLHCFTGSRAWGEAFMELGGYITVGGILTFKRAEDVREMFSVVPDDRFFLETDSPYLAPVPFRGKRNQPAHVVHVANKVAELRGWSVEDTVARTTQTARQFFGI